MAVGEGRLPARIPHLRPSKQEIIARYGQLLEARLTAAQRLVDNGGDSSDCSGPGSSLRTGSG
eukprot:9449490-Alexandrium_andersonii.AAC.1